MIHTLPTPHAAGSLNQEALAALFANLVIQHSNMALIFLGKVAHPETGQTFTDLEAARGFIDQLAMLEIKTKGNLSPEEGAMLQQSLTNLRLAFVEAVEAPFTGQSAPQPPSPAPTLAPADSGEEQGRKFSKKY